jgi:hypothetical protein
LLMRIIGDVEVVSFLDFDFIFLVVSDFMVGTEAIAIPPKVNADNITTAINFFIVFIFKFLICDSDGYSYITVPREKLFLKH